MTTATVVSKWEYKNRYCPWCQTVGECGSTLHAAKVSLTGSAEW